MINMAEPNRLTIEEEFKIRSFEEQVRRMSGEQAKETLIKLYQSQVVKESQYKALIKHKWGLG